MEYQSSELDFGFDFEVEEAIVEPVHGRQLVEDEGVSQFLTCPRDVTLIGSFA